MAVMLDTTTGNIVDMASVGPSPTAIGLDSTTGRVFVASHDDNKVTVLDAKSGAVLNIVAVGAGPVALAVDAHLNRVYVAGEGKTDDNGFPVGAGSLTVLNATTGAVLRSARLGQGPLAMAVDAQTGHVYVTLEGPTDLSGNPRAQGSVTVFNATTAATLASLHTGYFPSALAVDERTSRAYILNTLDDNVTIVNTATDVALENIAVGKYPSGIAVAGSAGRIFVTNLHSNSISVLDARLGVVLQTIATSSRPHTLAVDEHTGHILVVDEGKADANFKLVGNGNLTILDLSTGSIVRTIQLGFDPRAVAVDPQTGKAFVSVAGKQNSEGVHTLGIVDMVSAL